MTKTRLNIKGELLSCINNWVPWLNNTFNIKKIAPEFAWVNVTFPFGELYPRNVIDLKTRELCTVAALTVQGFSGVELKLHIDAALRTGSTQEEVIEVITQMIAYCGFPAATNALMIAASVFESHDTK